MPLSAGLPSPAPRFDLCRGQAGIPSEPWPQQLKTKRARFSSLSPDSFTSVRRLKKHSASYAKLPCPSTFWSCPPDIDIPFSWDYFCDIKQTGATSAIIRSFRRYRSYLFVREHAPLWKGVTMTRLLRSSNFWLPNRAL